MGWFWASDPKTPQRQITTSISPPQTQRSCPVDHSFRPPPGCPVHSSSRHAFNPRNNMPDLPNAPFDHSSNGISLPTTREMSTIPMNAQGEVWEYPSPQQMLNAMTRKGYDTQNPEDVPAMVAVHNWINEGSWEQILQWEKKYFPENLNPHLVKFSGRPGKPTPKSYILYKTGRSPKAFDHHEWFVSTTTEGISRRYVIDYYGVDDLTFSVDARPAVDDFATLKARTLKLIDDMKAKMAGNSKEDE